MWRWFISTGLIVGLLIVILISYNPTSQTTTETADGVYRGTKASTTLTSEVIGANNTKAIFFVGDIMLARQVERLSKQFGLDYPYRRFVIFPTDSLVVANFEAAVPAEHIPTPDFTFRFSVDEILLPPLRNFGVTHASLANNHAFDFGRAGYHNTIHRLRESDIMPFGHPVEIGESTHTILDLGQEKVALFGLMAIDSSPDYEALKTQLAGLPDELLTIAYIHWGQEYELRPSARQQAVARELVALGFNLIIGHHPHVVQSIGLVGDVPVIYSLGNFIFDQYFSAEVMTGLMLELKTETGSYHLSMFGVTSSDVRAQPRLMTEAEASGFFAELAEYSDDTLRSSIIAQRLIFEPRLASFRESVIMQQ